MCIISHTIQKILDDDLKYLFEFCFHLRKADNATYYTDKFLTGNMKPQILVEIVKANKWNSGKNQMEVAPEMAFKIKIGQSPDGAQPCMQYSLDR